MKRLISLVMVTVILLISSACAEIVVTNENFSIRNGIYYGINREGVSAVEAKNGSDYLLIPFSDLQYKTSLMGNATQIAYHFDDAGILKAFNYRLDSNNYAEIISAVAEKYGTPLFDGWLLDIWNSEEVSRYMSFKDSFKVSLYEYYGWLLQYSDCYVYIDFMRWSYSGSNAYTLCYTLLSYDEAQLAIEKYENYMKTSQESKYSDI